MAADWNDSLSDMPWLKPADPIGKLMEGVQAGSMIARNANERMQIANQANQFQQSIAIQKQRADQVTAMNDLQMKIQGNQFQNQVKSMQAVGGLSDIMARADPDDDDWRNEFYEYGSANPTVMNHPLWQQGTQMMSASDAADRAQDLQKTRNQGWETRIEAQGVNQQALADKNNTAKMAISDARNKSISDRAGIMSWGRVTAAQVGADAKVKVKQMDLDSNSGVSALGQHLADNGKFESEMDKQGFKSAADIIEKDTSMTPQEKLSALQAQSVHFKLVNQQARQSATSPGLYPNSPRVSDGGLAERPPLGPPASLAMPRPSSPEEAAKLPSGTIYVDGNGIKRRAP